MATRRDDRTRMPDGQAAGFYTLRLVRRGWRIGVQLFREDGLFWAEANGDPPTEPINLARLHTEMQEWLMGESAREMVLRLWLYGEPTTEADYRWRVEMRRWAEIHDPTHPAANPMRPVDTAKMNIIKL